MKIFPVTRKPTKADVDRYDFIRIVSLENDGSIRVTTVPDDHNWVNGSSVGYHPGTGVFVLGWIPAIGSENISKWVQENRTAALLECNVGYKVPEPQLLTKRKIRITNALPGAFEPDDPVAND